MSKKGVPGSLEEIPLNGRRALESITSCAQRVEEAAVPWRTRPRSVVSGGPMVKLKRRKSPNRILENDLLLQMAKMTLSLKKH